MSNFSTNLLPYVSLNISQTVTVHYSFRECCNETGSSKHQLIVQRRCYRTGVGNLSRVASLKNSARHGVPY